MRFRGGRATLLGVVFVMEKAGVAAPEPGGPITRWHAHNICLTAAAARLRHRLAVRQLSRPCRST